MLIKSSSFSETIVLKNSGTLKGWNTISYKINVEYASILKVDLNTKKRFIYFNIKKKESNKAIFIGHTEINYEHFNKRILEEGEYEVIVYFMRNEARRNNTGFFDLNITLITEGKMHSSWDVDNDGINDCEKDGTCDHTTNYSLPRNR